jgi:hypothetical protein
MLVYSALRGAVPDGASRRACPGGDEPRRSLHLLAARSNDARLSAFTDILVEALP